MMQSFLTFALAALFTASASAFGVAPASLRRPMVLSRAATPMAMADEEITFTFGDAADEVSTETATAIVEEEREMTDKEKEIARLRAAEKFMKKETGDAICKTCTYKYKWEEGVPGSVPPKTPWELVPDSFVCPNCKSPAAFFEPETMEIAGFADNQNYGFGTNGWTEAQKSTAIFGGLAAFFALFVGGYALN